MKKNWVLRVWNMVPFGGLLGRREIVVFLRTKSCRFKISSSFLKLLYSWSMGPSSNKDLNFLTFVDCIMDESVRA